MSATLRDREALVGLLAAHNGLLSWEQAAGPGYRGLLGEEDGQTRS